MSKLTASVLVFLLLIPSAAWTAFVGSTLWKWFAEPLGAPHLTVARAMGLAALFALYRYSPSPSDSKAAGDAKEGGDIFFEFVAVATLLPALILFLGWLYSQWL